MGMEVEVIEAVLEKIWELHDKLSDAIHTISRTLFLNSVKPLNKTGDDFFSASRYRTSDKKFSDADADGNHNTSGFVFTKDFCPHEDDSAIHEIKSLNAIRTALENLEYQLEFFHAVQTQQRADRDAAVARLERSRIVLAVRLAEHQGKNYKVLEEAQAFVGDVRDAGRFVSPENVSDSPSSPLDGKYASREGKKSNIFIKILFSSFNFMKRSLKLNHMGGILGNAVGGLLGNVALVTLSMFALMHMHQVTSKEKYMLEFPQRQEDSHLKRNLTRGSQSEDSSTGNSSHLDVLLARG